MRCAEVSCHPFERVRKPFGECDVLPCQCVGDLLDCRPLLLDELAEQLQIELAITADT